MDSIKSRTLSTPVRLAASISCTSVDVPAAISVHEMHSPHGVSVGPFSQLIQRARMRASVVLPVPRGPRQQQGVRDSVGADCIAKRCGDVSLTHHIVEILRSKLPR